MKIRLLNKWKRIQENCNSCRCVWSTSLWTQEIETSHGSGELCQSCDQLWEDCDWWWCGGGVSSVFSEDLHHETKHSCSQLHRETIATPGWTMGRYQASSHLNIWHQVTFSEIKLKLELDSTLSQFWIDFWTFQILTMNWEWEKFVWVGFGFVHSRIESLQVQVFRV